MAYSAITGGSTIAQSPTIYSIFTVSLQYLYSIFTGYFRRIRGCTDHVLPVFLGVYAGCILSALGVGPGDVVSHCHGSGTERERGRVLFTNREHWLLLNPRDHITQRQVVWDDWWLACSKLHTLLGPLLLVMLKVQDCKVDRFQLIKKRSKSSNPLMNKGGLLRKSGHVALWQYNAY